MKRIAGSLAAFVLFAGAPAGAMDPVQETRAALAQVESAAQGLSDADTGRDRVRALTETVQAFERGLAALRDGMRRVAGRQADLDLRLSRQEGDIGALLAALQSFSTRPAPVMLLHPAGPAGSARAALLMSDITQRLDAEAATLRRNLEELAALTALRDRAEAQLTEGLYLVQAARLDLNTAMSDRGPLPKRLSNDPVREAILLASTETLEQFAQGLDRITVDLAGDAPDSLSGEKGALPLPAVGRIRVRPGQPDPAGVTRPGLMLATAPGALVTSPSVATLRYVGQLLDFGTVVILEPQRGVLFVLAGLDVVYGSAGDIVGVGAPLGLMASDGEKNSSAGATVVDEAGARWSEALYIEVRQDNLPVDPGQWFQTEQDG